MKELKNLTNIRLLMTTVVSSLLLCTFGCPKGKPERVDFLLDWTAGPEYAGYIIAKERGFYKAEGLDVSLTEGNGANEAAQLIASGKYKIGVSSAAAVILVNDKGQNLKSCAVVFGKSPSSIYSLKERNITKPEDLLHKKLGVLYQSSTYLEYTALMNLLGLPMKGVKEIGISWGIEPILNGDVDAAMGYTQNQPNLVRLQGKEINEILVDDFGLKIYSSVIAVNPEFRAKNLKMTQKIIRASLKGWAYALEHPDEAEKIILSAYPALKADFVHLSLKSTLALIDQTVSPLGYQNMNRWEMTAKMLLEQKLILKPAALKGIVDNAAFGK